MVRHLNAAALVCVLAAPLTGCGTLGGFSAHASVIDEGNFVYTGLRLYIRDVPRFVARGWDDVWDDVGWLTIPLYLLIPIDFPISLAVDTAILPVTLPLTLARYKPAESPAPETPPPGAER